MGRRIKSAIGFTLIELLIVVVILSSLAAIVVPQFSQSTNSAKLAALDTNLTALRSAIALYAVEHGHYPGSVPSSGTCAVGTNSENATLGAAALVAHLTLYTTAEGVACTAKNGNSGGSIKFGPYLRTRQFPENPITGSNHIEAVETGLINLKGYNTGASGGWRYDVKTGEIIADQTEYDDR